MNQKIIIILKKKAIYKCIEGTQIIFCLKESADLFVDGDSRREYRGCLKSHERVIG
jgi:hypothetical protein